ncbi:MAG: helix-turn-helix transcriptional regulator [Caulobacterales bacterium]|nr:helix-turn-helix transcriptional regulator [Caulobacterales bacterium]
MEIKQLTDALAALAHPERLRVFRLLAPLGETGLSAGEISVRLKAPANTLTARLNLLVAADLLSRRRDGRSVIYFVNPDGVRTMIQMLTQDCCQGRAELCGSADFRSARHAD